MKKINLLLLALFLTSNTVTAGKLNNLESNESLPWSIIGSLGYAGYAPTYKGYPINTQPAIDDGQTAIGRFAIAKEAFNYKNLYFGIETAIQSGNTFRLRMPENDLINIGGILPQATIKPELDFLATMFYKPLHSLMFGVAKLGPSWRRMQINDRESFNDLAQIGLELQLGFGASITKKAQLSLNYQLISNGTSTCSIDTEQGIGKISNIPKQNGLLLSLTYLI